MTFVEFLDKQEDQWFCWKWAAHHPRASVTEGWLGAYPDIVVWMATRPGVLDHGTLRKFAVWCARRCLHLATDPASKALVDLVERSLSEPISGTVCVHAVKEAEPAAMRSLSESESYAVASMAALMAAEYNPESAACRTSYYSVLAIGLASGCTRFEIENSPLCADEYMWQARWLRHNALPNFTCQSP